MCALESELMFCHITCGIGYNKTEGAVYTMDHELAPRLSKAADWLLKLSWHNFGLHHEKMAEGPWRSRSPKYNF